MTSPPRPKRKREVVHWWRQDNPYPHYECGATPKQDEFNYFSWSRAHVTCKRCLVPRTCTGGCGRAEVVTSAPVWFFYDAQGRPWCRDCAALELGSPTRPRKK